MTEVGAGCIGEGMSHGGCGVTNEKASPGSAALRRGAWRGVFRVAAHRRAPLSSASLAHGRALTRELQEPPMPIRVTVWNEFRHEKKNPAVGKIYPEGMHQAIGSHLRKASDLQVRTATLDEP